MRNATAGEQAVLASRYTKHYLKVEIQDALGDWIDYSDYIDVDRQDRAEVVRDSSRVGTFSIELAREIVETTGVVVSLSPLINSDIAIGRGVRISGARVAMGSTPGVDDWKQRIVGRVDRWEAGQDPMVLSGRDLAAGTLLDRKVEEATAYGGSGEFVQDLIQQLIDDWADGLFTLVLDADSPLNVTPFAFDVPFRVDEGTSVWEACMLLAEKAGGHVIEYRWSDDSEAFELTLRRPDRTASSPQWTFGPNDYYLDTGVQLTAEALNVRNAWVGSYKDAVTGLRAIATAEDPTSIANYGRLWAKITEADDSPIDTADEMQDMLDAALADTANPDADHEIEVDWFWPSDLEDYYRHSPNSVHYTANQDYAVVGLRDIWENGTAVTRITTRGKPSGRPFSWRRRAKQQVAAEIDANPSLDEDDGAWYLYPNRRSGAEAVYYTFTTDGTEPADPLGADEAVGPVGTLSTAAEILVTTSVLDGEVVRVKVKAVQNADGTGLVGPVRPVRGTFHAGDDRPNVSWFPYQPTDITKEGIRFVAQDDSGTVNVGYAVINEGAAEPTWPGSYTLTGLVSDPARIEVSIARPAEGAAAKLVYYQAVDAAGNLAFDKPQVIRVDSNIVPSGWFDTPAPDAGTSPRPIPNTDDSDTGSWRLFVFKTTEGDDTVPAHATGDFDDGDVDQFSGATFGVPVDLDTTHRLNPGEKLNCVALFFRTTTATAAAQAASVASEEVIFQVRPNAQVSSNSLGLGPAYWAPWDTASPGFWKFVMNLAPGTNIESMHVSWYDLEFGPGAPQEYDKDLSPGVPVVHELEASGGGSPPAGFASNRSLHITITPYDADGGAAGAGTPGPTLEIDTGPADVATAGPLIGQIHSEWGTGAELKPHFVMGQDAAAPSTPVFTQSTDFTTAAKKSTFTSDDATNVRTYFTADHTNHRLYLLSGLLWLDGAVESNTVRIACSSGTAGLLGFYNSTTKRWRVGADGSTESGSNAGNAFSLFAYSDAGALIDTPITVTRAAGGAVTLARPITHSATAFSFGNAFVYRDAAVETDTLRIACASGTAGLVGFYNTTKRWRLGADGTTEAGSNAGNSFVIFAYSDAGSIIDTPVTITRAAAGIVLVARPLAVSGASGTDRTLRIQSAGVDRWRIVAVSTAESGSNAGSDFSIQAYDDAGAVIDTPLSIFRASGSRILINRPLQVNGAAGTVRSVRFVTSAVDRWVLQAGSGAETGSNAGSNFNISAYTDAGVLIDNAIVIARASGGTLTVNRPLTQSSTAFSLGNAFLFRDGATETNTVRIACASGTAGLLGFYNTTKRWRVGADGSTESGSNVGNDFAIFAYDDSGSIISAATVTILRATGKVGIGGGTPGQMLDVMAVIADTPSIRVRGTDTATSFILQAGRNVTDGGSVGARMVINDAGTSGVRWDISNGGNAAGALTFIQQTAGVELIRMTSALLTVNKKTWITDGAALDGTYDVGDSQIGILDTRFSSSDSSAHKVGAHFMARQEVATTGSIQGVETFVYTKHTSGTVATVFGAISNILIDSSGGTVTNAYGWNVGGVMKAGTLTTFAAVRVVGLTYVGGTFTTQYGVYVDVAGASTNWSIYATNGNVTFRTSALATNATTGHLFIPSSAGAPTGVPASIPTGQVALQYDTTNNKLYAYNGAWKQVAMT